MRTALRNMAVVVAALIPLAVIDYFYVKSGQDPSSFWGSRWLNWPALMVAPAGFFWANWPAIASAERLAHITPEGRIGITALLALLAAVMWFFVVAFTVIGNLHISLGGTL